MNSDRLKLIADAVRSSRRRSSVAKAVNKAMYAKRGRPISKVLEDESDIVSTYEDAYGE